MKQYVRVGRKGDLEPGTGKTVDVNRTPEALIKALDQGWVGDGARDHQNLKNPF